ncbi:MAG: LLM class flavin-dependent oxidoreductase [Gammaproteobacteria bacterium]
MKFGFTLPKLYEPGARDPYRHMYELCAFAEDLGFDFCATGHHSFTPDSGDESAPFALLSAVAARTRRLRLATGIYLLSLYHPVVVAEQLATLDVISGGRAIFGIGVGYRGYEFRGHGMDQATRGPRTSEAMAAMRRAFETGRWGFEGRHWNIPDNAIHPRPVQSPHPPFWVGGTTDPALRRAATLGDGWMSDNMLDIDAERERAGTYRRMCADAGRPAGTVCILRSCWVEPTRERALAAVLPPLRRFLETYKRAGTNLPFAKGVYGRIAHGETVGVDDLTPGRNLIGTPDDLNRELVRWRDEVGTDAMELLILGPADFERLKAMLALFAREVLPNFTA